MLIERLTISQLRNIEYAEIQPSSQINLITGRNAAGKSTVLESIDLLSRGRSFRSHLFGQLVTTGHSKLTIGARLRLAENAARNVGIEKSRTGTRMRIDGEAVDSVAPLAALMPVQVLHPESHQLIQGSPAYRRAYIDWGMFHVEPRFLPVWQRFQRLLRQRNAALKSRAGATTAGAWNLDFCETAHHLDEYRRYYLKILVPVVAEYVKDLPGDANLKLRYQRGWPNDKALSELLEQEQRLDLERGYTRRGPHRAELELFINENPANGAASRGQQKLIAAALKLAQAKLLITETARRCVFLIDDLPAELEPRYRDFLLQSLVELDLQIFVTAISANGLNLDVWPAAQLFHVEQGCIRELL